MSRQLFGPRELLLTSTPFVGPFVLVPASLYLHAGEDWGFDQRLLLLLAAIGLVLYGIVALALHRLARHHAKAARLAASALFCLGLLVLLTHVYAPIQIGPLDGSALRSGEPALYSLVELVLLALMIGVFVLLQRGRGSRLAGIFAGLVLVAGLGYLAATLSSGEGRSPIREVSAAHGSVPEGNVYHIVLDMMDTAAFESGLERLGLHEGFQGFDFFEHNTAGYINTAPSSANYMSGTFYHEGDWKDWLVAWRENGLFAQMVEAGYISWVYSVFADWRGEHTHHFRHHLAVYEDAIGIDNARFYDFAQIWLASLAPNALTNEALARAGRLQRAVFRRIAVERPLSAAEGIDPYASMLMLERLIAEEEARPGDGQYVYAHFILPHGPEVIDRRCRYRGLRANRSRPQIRADFLEQTECALTLLTAFFDRLRQLGRYEAATIVVHADTGHWSALPEEVGDNPPTILGKKNAYLKSWVHAPLLIKRPAAGHPLRTVETPTQLVDIVPTLIDLLDLEQPGYGLHGRSVYGPDATRPRETRFGFDPTKPYGPDIIEIRIDEPTDIARSGLTVIGPATDPVNRRAEVRAAHGG